MMYDPFEQMYRGTWGNRILNVVSGIALVVCVSWFSYTVFAARSVAIAPRIVNSITVEPTILLPGKPFTVRVNVTLNKLCQYEIHWSLVRQPDGLEVVKIVEGMHPADAPLGTSDLPPRTRYVPSSVEPGDYKYVSEIFDICGDGHTYPSVRSGIPITIR